MTSVLARLATATTPVDRTTAYGPHPDQVYDVRAPSGPVRDATALVVHGGFWRPAYDRAHATGQSEALAANGFHVATIEYRRADEGGWPDLRDDVAAAAAAVVADPGLPGPVVLVGHSAGGHLVLWLQHHPAVRPALAGTVALAPCADLHLVHRLGLDGDAALALLGVAPEDDPQAWDAADPARLGAPPRPVRILHGTADDRVPVAVSASYREQAGGATALDVLPGVDHFALIDPTSAAFTRCGEVIDALSPRLGSCP